MRIEASAKLGYVPALDGLRCLAIVVVMLNHAEPILGWSLLGGVVGVDLFFVLSGFLIATLLLERDGERLRRFYTRRALRLFPAVYVLIIIVTAIAAIRYHQAGEYLRADGWVLIYATNWAIVFDLFHAPMLDHLWTLAIEEQFYLLFPLPFLIAWHRRPSFVFPAILALIAAVVVWRAWYAWQGTGRIDERFDMRFDELLAGAALAVARWKGTDLRRLGRWWPAALVAFIAIAATYDYHSRLDTAIGIPAVTVASIVLVAGAVTRAPRILCFPIVVAIGVYSYSIYLWHLPVFDLAGDVHSAPRAAKIAIGITATIAAALASYYLIEQPFLRLKNHVGGRLDSSARPQEV